MPETLREVEVTPLKPGENLRVAHARRTGELVKANGRITSSRDYMLANCAPKAPPK